MTRSHVWVTPEKIDSDTIARLRVAWRTDARVDRVIPLRALRFCCAGEVLTHGSVGEWYRLVADLLTGRLDDGLAPCTRDMCPPSTDEVRSVSRAEIDWPRLESREWAVLERAGVSRALRLRLTSDETEALDAPTTEALDAARALLAHVPAGPLQPRIDGASELVRATLLTDALAASGGQRDTAAAALGVRPERVAELLRPRQWIADAWPVRPGRRAKKP